MSTEEVFVDQTAVAAIDRKIRESQKLTSGMANSWSNPFGGDYDSSVLNPGPRVPKYKLGKQRAQEPSVSIQSKETVRSVVAAPQTGFSLDRIFRCDIFAWLKSAPRGWADIIIADPTLWNDRGTSWSTDFGFERTRYEYDGKIMSLCAEFARISRLGAAHLYLLGFGKAPKIKEFGWNLVEEIRPSIGDHSLWHYTKHKHRTSSQVIPCDLTPIEGLPFPVIDTECVRFILQESGQEGSNVFSPFAGSGSICRSAKELGMFYVGVEKDDYSKYWNFNV